VSTVLSGIREIRDPEQRHATLQEAKLVIYDLVVSRG
jgi:hypothetical protein